MESGHCGVPLLVTACGHEDRPSELRGDEGEVCPLVRETVPTQVLATENDPVSCLDRLAAQSSRKARRSGRAMAVGDTIEATEGWPRDLRALPRERNA